MGPLSGFKVIELAGIGPGPMCAMLLADMGAEVIRVDRTGDSGLGVQSPAKFQVMNRSRRSIAVDLKSDAGREVIFRLVEQADALIEGFRPGVCERLGLGPEDCWKRNPKLVFGRVTGWGQTGPMAHAAGHDINYIALTGALHAIGRPGEKPVPPLNLVGDFGGGALYLAVGVLAALLEAQKSGKGQVVDAAMVDGAASLMAIIYGLLASGLWLDQRGANMLDGGAPFYDVYDTKDGKQVAIGSIEPKFYAELMELSGLGKQELPAQFQRDQWPAMKERFAAVFRTKTRDEWCAIMEGSDVCFAPVMSMNEAANHPHMKARSTFVEVQGVVQPAPAPRFSRTPGEISRPPAERGEHTAEALRDWGFSADELDELKSAGAIGG